MAKACSIEAGRLSPVDKSRYNTVKGKKNVGVHAARQASVQAMLREAKSERRQIVAEIQRVHPDIVNNNGEFFEDLEAQRFESEAQQEMDLPQGKTDASKETKKKTRSKKPSSAAVATKEQPKSSTPTPERAAADPVVTKGNSLKKGGAKKASKPKKPSEEASESKLVSEPEPQQSEREEQQPANIESTNERTVMVETAVASLKKAKPTSSEWQDAARVIIYTALVESPGGDSNSKPNKVAHARASDIVNGSSLEADSLWDGGETLVHRLFSDVLNQEVRSLTYGAVSYPKFEKHNRLWKFSLDNGIFPAVLARLGRSELGINPVYPTNPSPAMIKLVPSLGTGTKISKSNEDIALTDDAKRVIAEVAAAKDAYLFSKEVNISNELEVDSDLDAASVDDFSSEVSGLGADNRFNDGTDNKLNEGADNMFDNLFDNNSFDIDSRNSLVDLEGNPVTKPMSLGTVKMMVSKFRVRLSKTFNVRMRTYKNVAELQRKNPELYKAAQAAHEGNQVIPNNAAGVAFDRTVLIFSDNIANKQHLAFVMSHEVIGHFGIASIMPKAEFKKLLADVYQSDPKIRNAADRMIEGGLDKDVAIEEALADYAAEMDNSLVMRIGATLKRILNRLGFKFNDDMTRYFVYHSRRYVRDGISFDASAPAIHRNLLELESRAINTRYSSTDSTNNFHDGVVMGQGGLSDIIYGASGLTQRMVTALKGVADTRGATTSLEGARNIYGNALEHLQSLGNLAKKNLGMARLYEALHLEGKEGSRLKTKYNDLTSFSHLSSDINLLKKLGWTGKGGPTMEQLEQADRVLELYLQARGGVDINERLRSSGPLIQFDKDGVPSINKDTERKLKDQAKLTKEQLEAGIEVPVFDDLTGEQATKDGKPLTRLIKLKTKTISDEAWRVVTEVRNAVDEADLDMYLNTVSSVVSNRNNMWQEMRKSNEALTNADESILDEILTTYSKLYNVKRSVNGRSIEYSKSSMRTADQFLRDATRVLDTKDGKAKLDDWIKGSTEDSSKGTEELRTSKNPDIDRIIPKLATLQKDKAGKGISGGGIKNTIAKMHMMNVAMERAELAAKNTILTAYVPLNREGKYQVRVEATVDGKTVELHDTLAAHMYMSRTDSLNEVKSRTEELNSIFKDLKPMDLLGKDADQVYKNVKFVAVQSTSLELPPMGGIASYGEVINLLNHSGITLDALDRQKLVQMAAAQGGGVRHSLQRKFVPGWNPDIRKGVWKHLERRANSSSKKLYEHEIARIFADRKLWVGDPVRLRELQDAWLITKKGTGAEFHARREMDSYQYQFIQSSASTNITFYDSKTGKMSKVAGKGDGDRVLGVAVQRSNTYRAQSELPTNTGDEKLGELSGATLSVASIAQLSLSVATAIVNMTAIASHSATYLSTYNQKTGYGGGHGMSATTRAIIQAGSDLSLIKAGLKRDKDGRLGDDVTGNVQGLTAIVKRLKLKSEGATDNGLTLDEAQMLLDKTSSGVLTPNLTNALTGAGRFGRNSNRITNTIGNMMFMFSKSEQYNRRVTALASYRLDRAKMDNKQLTEAQKKALYNRADDAVNFSQGNYDKFNYPSIAQGPVLRYLYLYKMFQTITIEHLWSMAPKERTMFLVFIALTAGITGIPFAENFADLLDTLMEIFGIKWSGLELEASKVAEAVGIPSALIMHGLVNHYTGVEWASRAGYGNPIPGLGMFKADAQPMRIVKDIVGPVYSAWEGVFGSAAMIGRYGLESIGLRPDSTTLGDIARGGLGISALKNVAKGVTYLVDGTVVNKEGKTIVRNVGAGEAMMQMLGFGPAAIGKQYNTNRLSNYARTLSTEYTAEVISSYLKASKSGQRDILRGVRDTNRKVGRDSPFYVSDVRGKIQRKKKSNAMTASERNLKTLPKNLKKLGRSIMESQGLDAEGMPAS